ncbi:MAG TPA: FAD-dependent monooxygenase [Pseudolabrys sp.]|nr:FAD-dependent monooxygenase [Pseudolabrys sp.]
MHVAIVGAGPAGLYLAYLIKRRQPGAAISIFEQNPPDATFGFGVVFSDRALEFLREDDEETFKAIIPHVQSWSDIVINHRGEPVVIDGIGFAAIGRLKLLQLLRARGQSIGVELVYRHIVKDVSELDRADLIVGADGVNSLVRKTYAREFGTDVRLLSNRFAWFGTSKRFETLTQTFVRTEWGCFNAHHYRYAPSSSTFIVEVDAPTFERAGLAGMNDEGARRLCERVFADVLQGHALLSNNSIWRQFPIVRNERWHFRNHVLVGDALHTAHFSIGSGTRLALEDAIALDRALAGSPGDLEAALSAYEAARRPILEKLVAGANQSAAWYENFAQEMQRAPLDFAMSYVTRSGRVALDRLQKQSPLFVRRFKEERIS